NKLVVGKLALRVLVKILHVAVRRRGVEIEVVILDIFAVVALVGHNPEGALLQYRIALVPERQSEDQQLITVADAGEAVFAQAVGLGPRHAMRQMPPRVAVGAVVFAHCAPGSLTDVRSPPPPRWDSFSRFSKSFMNGCRRYTRGSVGMVC